MIGGARASRWSEPWFKMVYSLRRRKTFVGGKCALPSALLVFYDFAWFAYVLYTAPMSCIRRV